MPGEWNVTVCEVKTTVLWAKAPVAIAVSSDLQLTVSARLFPFWSIANALRPAGLQNSVGVISTSFLTASCGELEFELYQMRGR